MTPVTLQGRMQRSRRYQPLLIFMGGNLKGTPEYVKRHMKDVVMTRFSKKVAKPAPVYTPVGEERRGPLGLAQLSWEANNPVNAANAGKATFWREHLLTNVGYSPGQIRLFQLQPWYCLSLHVRKSIKKYVRKHPEQFVVETQSN